MKRAIIIIQLCFVFITICWYGGYPFMGELFELRSQAFIARTVMGDQDLLQYSSENQKEHDSKILKGNFSRFGALPKEKQLEVTDVIGNIKKKMDQSFMTKLKKGINLLLFDLPILKRAWLFMSLALSFGILLSVDGSRSATWVLPILSFGYFFFSYMEPQKIDPFEKLYPQFEELPEGENLQNQWEKHLIKTWAPEQGIEEAKFLFNVALLNAYQTREKNPIDHPLYCFVFFAWNLFFAYSVNTGENVYAKKARKRTLDSTCHPI